MRFKIVLAIGLSGWVFHPIASTAAESGPAENNPPKVTITKPADNGSFRWNAVVPYAIDVSDREDGKTEFEEIVPNEVLLTISYLPDASRREQYLQDLLKADNQTLRRMGTSNCLTCHAAKSTLIGPSFELIAKRYPNTPETMDALAKKVLTGATGVWGNVPMPPHPDLKIEQSKEMVAWILKNGADTDQSFAMGIEGAFKTREKKDGDAGAGIYVLTATYMDHGLKGVPQSNKQGQHTIVPKPAQ